MIQKGQEITPEVIEEFINGHDPMKGIVNVECGFQDKNVKITYRNDNDEKCIHYDAFYPFLWAKRSVCQRMCDGDRKKLKMLMFQYHIGVEALDVTNVKGQTIPAMQEGYCFRFYAQQPMSQKTFNSFFKKTGQPLKIYTGKIEKDGKKEKINNPDYLVESSVNQFLISSGKRFFKGWDDYDRILRMIFDLETQGLDPKRHRITQIGIRFNRPFKDHPDGFERIFSITGNTKEELDACELRAIDAWLRVIYTFQPDVLTGHNIFVFDLPFICERCIQLGTTIEEMSAKYFNGNPIHKETFATSLKLGGETEKFFRTIVPGIIVTDSMQSVRRAQATDSSFMKSDLKYATNYLGLKKANRVYTPGDKIAKIWSDKDNVYAFNDKNGDWYLYNPNYPGSGNKTNFKPGKEGDKPFKLYTRNFLADGYELTTGKYIVERYLLDDVWESDKVESALNSTDFMLTKIIPLPYSKVVTMGTAGQWKAIMMAWSYENHLAIPDAPNTGSFTGGLSRLLVTGFVKNVVKLDYNSLYPSILLTWGIEDENDLSGVMLKLLLYVLTTRETHKNLKKAADKKVGAFEKIMNEGVMLTAEELEEYQMQLSVFKIEDNRQASVKKLGNSYFGAFGSNNGKVYPWKSPVCAERTTCTGRQSLRLMISHFHNLGDFVTESKSSLDLNTEDMVYIKYMDSGTIEKINVEEISNSQDVFILINEGWCRNGQIEDITPEDKIIIKEIS